MAEMTRVLDVDLDFFVQPVAHWVSDEGARLPEADYETISVDNALAYLRGPCRLAGRLPGWVIEHHDEAFERWRSGIESALLKPPFHVTHLDAHADLGLGDSGYLHILTHVMRLPVGERSSPENLVPELNFSNWLAFAVASRWVGELVYVFPPGGGGDLFPLYTTANGNDLQLMPWTRAQIDQRLHGGFRETPVEGVAEPVVPVRQIRAEEFTGDGEYDAIVLCRSPGYTPASADKLFDAILDEFIDVLE